MLPCLRVMGMDSVKKSKETGAAALGSSSLAWLALLMDLMRSWALRLLLPLEPPVVVPLV